MGLSCGIVGLPNVGKSTLFSALSSAKVEIGNFPFCTIEPNQAIIEVPDRRLDVIKSYIDTSKVVPAALKVIDIAGLVAGASEGEGMGNKFLGNIKECDAILHVVRCFGGDKVIRDGIVDPVGDIEVIELELTLADLETVRRGIERVSKKARLGDKELIFQKEVFEKAMLFLETNRPLRVSDWLPEEVRALRPLCLMTMKPILYVANVSDEDLEGEGELASQVSSYARKVGSQCIAICGDLEAELRSLDAEERVNFMADLGVDKLGLDRLIQASYSLLGLHTYFTAGEKEIRAWTIRKGDKAPVAAGVIHSDFTKRFIRAEVYSVADLEEYKTEVSIKAAGKLRTEGRDYILQDGDICHFLLGN